MEQCVREYFAEIGRKGGKASGKMRTPGQVRATARNLAKGPKAKKIYTEAYKQVLRERLVKARMSWKRGTRFRRMQKEQMIENAHHAQWAAYHARLAADTEASKKENILKALGKAPNADT